MIRPRLLRPSLTTAPVWLAATAPVVRTAAVRTRAAAARTPVKYTRPTCLAETTGRTTRDSLSPMSFFICVRLLSSEPSAATDLLVLGRVGAPDALSHRGDPPVFRAHPGQQSRQRCLTVETPGLSAARLTRDPR